MRVVRTIDEVRKYREGLKHLGFVPTMGALHEGHLSLVRYLRDRDLPVSASIFVNPTQFGPTEDFSRYPRTLDADLAALEHLGVEMVFVPDANDIYRNDALSVKVSRVSDRFEGAIRPGHFDGVATIVLKLFTIIQPTEVAFGQKDLQQCAVIRAMIRDFFLPIEMHVVATCRESDGLAMSSRNRYLSEQERSVAPLLYRTLSEIRDRMKMKKDPHEQCLADGQKALTNAGFSPDYLACVHPDTFEDSRDLDTAFLVVAARLGAVRLLDNANFS